MKEPRADPAEPGLAVLVACLILAAPVAAATSSLDVAVADQTGRPLEGAFVMALPSAAASRSADLAPQDVRHAVTGVDGRALLEALPPGPWRVTVHARGFVARSVRGVTGGPLAVTLDRGGVATGTVVSSLGRRPVAGATVALVLEGPLPTGWPEDVARNVAISDAQGRFRLEGVGPSPQALSARAPGHAIGERRDVRAGDHVEIVLFPGSTLRGAVRDGGGRPVEGALVRAEADRFWGEEPPPQRTDGQGRFEMAGVTPGEYTVVAREGGRAPAFGRAIVEPEAEATVSLVLSDGGFVAGRVVDERGRPLRARVRVDVVDELPLSASMSHLVAAESKEDGAFALGPLPVGALGLEVSAPRYAPRRLEAHVSAPGRTADLGDVALEAGLAIRGSVRDGESRALPGATLTARSAAPGGRRSVETEGDEGGAFVIGGLEAGPYRLTATAPGHAWATTQAEAGGQPLEIVLRPAGTVTGRVLDARGRPARDARVGARVSEDPAVEVAPLQASADPADGSFRLEGLAAGAYDVEVRAGGHAPTRLSSVRVVAGRTTDVGDLTVALGGVVKGSVVDADGRGIAGASVYLETSPDRLTEELASKTGPAGDFEIRGVPPGRVLLRAAHPSFAPGLLPEVRVDPTAEPEPVRIALGRGARVEGRVRRRDGRPFTAGRVIVQSSAPGAAYAWPEPLPFDDQGAFVAEHVPSGPAHVHVLAFTPQAAPPSAGPVTTLSPIGGQPVVLVEGETAAVEVALRDVVVDGRVTRGGRAAGGIRVSVFPGRSISFSGLKGAPPPTEAAGPSPLAATTREDGSYELLVFGPGPARVGLRAAASGQGYPSRDVVVPDTGRFSLDIDLAEASVSGAVLDGEAGAPLPGVLLRLSARQDGRPGAGARSGPDGRFDIAAESGEYVLSAELPGRVRLVLPVTVGPEGLADVRLEMDRGLAISGRLLDADGRPAAGQTVVAIGADGFERSTTRADGSFRLEGLTDRPYALSAGSTLAGFATRRGVRPGPDAVDLALQPAGRVELRVVSPDGQPVAGAFASVAFVDGAPLHLGGSVALPTGSEGSTEVGVPAGEVGIAVSAESGAAFGTVVARSGETVPLVVVLQPGPAPTP